MNIDEAALKADPSDSEIMEIAGRWFHTGENQHRADGYYYRSLGTPTNVRGSDLIAFARALLHRSQGQEPVAEGFVDQHGKVINASATIGYLRPCPEDAANGCKIIPLFTHPAPVAVVPAEQAEDSAMLDWLEPQQGVNLVSDDAGKWAVSDSGVQECPPEGGFTTPTAITSFVDPEDWKPTIREAIRAAMSNREAGGS